MRLPRTQAALQLLLNEARNSGYNVGFTEGTERGRKLEAEALKQRKDQLNTNCLQALASVAESMGRTVESISRAMYDGRGM